MTPKTSEPAGNDSGLTPVEYKVLVRPDAPFLNKVPADGQEFYKTDGGILIPQDAEERQQHAMARGTLVAVGGNAFSDFAGRKPMVGEKVMYGRYSGQVFDGKDKQEYRILNDKDIAAIWS